MSTSYEGFDVRIQIPSLLLLGVGWGWEYKNDISKLRLECVTEFATMFCALFLFESSPPPSSPGGHGVPV